MKKIVSLLFVSVTFISCGKEEKVVVDTANESNILREIQNLSGLNAEGQRIQEDILDADYTVAIIDNPNYGRYSATPEYDIMMSGASQSGYSISINDDVYSADKDGQWLRQSILFKDYLGTDVTIEIESPEGDSFSFERYIPSGSLAAPLAKGSQAHQISRNGNVIHYTTDEANPAEAVALVYRTWETPSLGSIDGMVDNNLILLDNSGSYNIDSLIAEPNVERIDFRLISGNTVSQVINGEKFLFYIATYDHHEYGIADSETGK